MSFTDPLVSVVLPFRNAEATLFETLESVQVQSFSDFELLLIDDGSTDQSLSMARAFQDERFRIITDGRKAGIARRLNEGAQLAKGKYIARMDADDIMHPKRLERQIAEMHRDSTIDVLGSDAWAIDQKARVLALYTSADPSTDPWAVVRNGLFIHPTVLGKAEWFRANPYSETIVRAEDLELWTRCCSHSRFHVLHEPLLYYRFRGPWSISPVLSSERSVDSLILEWGGKTSHLSEARTCVRLRRIRRWFWVLAAICGIRWLRWKFKYQPHHQNRHRRADVI